MSLGRREFSWVYPRGWSCARLNGTTGALQQILIPYAISMVNSVIFSQHYVIWYNGTLG